MRSPLKNLSEIKRLRDWRQAVSSSPAGVSRSPNITPVNGGDYLSPTVDCTIDVKFPLAHIVATYEGSGWWWAPVCILRHATQSGSYASNPLFAFAAFLALACFLCRRRI